MRNYLAIAVVSALAVIAFSSCKKDNPDDKPKAQFGYATVTAKYFINDDLDKVADITLNFTKFDGSKMSLPVSTTQQVVDVDKYKGTIPATLSFNFSATQEKGELTKDSYNCSLDYEITVKVFDSEGNLKKANAAKDKIEMGEKKSNVDLVITRLNRLNGKVTIKEDMSIETGVL